MYLWTFDKKSFPASCFIRFSLCRNINCSFKILHLFKAGKSTLNHNFFVRFPEKAVSVLRSGCLESLLLRSLYTDRQFWASRGGVGGLRPLIETVELRGKILLQHIRDRKLQLKRDLWMNFTVIKHGLICSGTRKERLQTVFTLKWKKCNSKDSKQILRNVICGELWSF